jgi:DNA-binding transcriptional LysR family regulator
MRRLSLLNLETLCWIARLGTFTAAAERLNTTQPAISKRVKELEQTVRVPLFQRRGRKLELTIQGRHLVQRAQPLLSRLEEVVVSLDNLTAATGMIRMGVGEIVAATWFGKLMARLKEQMPGVNYEIEVGLTVNMRHKLELGKLDLAIIAAPAQSSLLATSYLGSIDARWLAAPALRTASNKGRANVKQMLEAHPIWCVARPSHMYPMAVETLRRHGVAPTNINTSDNVQSIVELVANGAGIGLLPQSLAAGLMKSKRLVPLSDELPAERLDLVIAHHRTDDQAIIHHIVHLAVETSAFLRKSASA